MDGKLNALLEVVLVFILLLAAVRLFEALPWGEWIGYLCILSLFIVLIIVAVRKNDFSRYGISPLNTENKVRAASR